MDSFRIKSRASISMILAAAATLVMVGNADAAGTSPEKIKQCQAAMALGDFGKVKQILAGDKSSEALVLNFEAFRQAESTDGKDFLVQAQKLTPKSSAVLTGLGWVALREKRYDDAIASLGDALKADAGNVDAMSMQGRCLHKKGKKDDGYKIMKDALQKAPTDVNVTMELAKSYSDDRDNAKAEELITKLIAAHPHDVLPLLKRATVYIDMAKTDASLSDVNKALSLNPHCQAALSMRARIYQDQKKYDKALADCTECINQKDGMENITRKCRRTKVRTEEDLGHNGAAVAELEKLTKGVESEKVKWTDDSEQAFIKLAANYEALKKYPEAMKAVAVVQRFVPASTQAMFYKARILTEMGKDKESLTEYDKLIATNPAVRDWHLDKAKVLRKMGQTAAADQETKTAQGLKK